MKRPRGFAGCLSFSVLVLMALNASVSESAEREKNEFPADVLNVLKNSDKLTLYSILPNSAVPKDSKDAKDPAKFHRYKVLGKSDVGAQEKSKLIDALVTGVAENQGEVAECFLPRHGIHAEFKDVSVDLLICFQCRQIEAYVKSSDEPTIILVSGLPKAVLNAILKAAKVSLAPDIDCADK